jgi:hypothetical protein
MIEGLLLAIGCALAAVSGRSSSAARSRHQPC